MLFCKTYLVFIFWSMIMYPKPLGPDMFQIQNFSKFRKNYYSLMTAGLNGVELLPPVSREKYNTGR